MNARSQLVTPLVREPASLDEAERREMFALFRRYYEAASYGRFLADLADKTSVLLLRDEGGAVCGFSTLALYERAFAGSPLRVLFSGDTVVDERHWGQQALAFAWLRLAGEIKAERPQTPLYWFLISKGHRTYRYLSAFSREFYPAPGRATPPRAGIGPLPMVTRNLAGKRPARNWHGIWENIRTIPLGTTFSHESSGGTSQSSLSPIYRRPSAWPLIPSRSASPGPGCCSGWARWPNRCRIWRPPSGWSRTISASWT